LEVLCPRHQVPIVQRKDTIPSRGETDLVSRHFTSVLLLIAASLSMGCQSNEPSRPVARSRFDTPAQPGRMHPSEEMNTELDLGQDWDSIEDRLGVASASHRRQRASSSPVDLPAGGSKTGDPSSGFGIVLATFTSTAHADQAVEYRRKLGILLPSLDPGLRTHPDSRGSLVVFGSYTDWTDPDARADVQRLRNLTVNNRQIFPQAMIAELKVPRDPGTVPDNELVSLRIKYPDVRTLYTLEIAVWGDFESGEYPPSRRRSAAEGYARALRQQGMPAFFHHDDARQMSMVTVGVFDYSAMDASTGIKSPEVERFVRQFPRRLVNGEPLIDLYDPQDPAKGGRPQPPRLVEVPLL